LYRLTLAPQTSNPFPTTLKSVSLVSLVVACLSVTCICAPAWAGTAYVDGVSDQGLMSWSGGFSEGGGPDPAFASYFDGSWAHGPSTHIKLARYVVQWDVMGGAGYPEELANLQRWYAHATALGLTPDVALDNYNCEGCTLPQAPAEYDEALQALFRAFPEIAIVEAWNEPNDSHYSSYVPPELAAGFTNAAYAFCRGHGCTTVAGDLLDSEANMLEYERQYESYLNPRDPGNWGIHPYHAVKYMSAETVASFREALPDAATDSIWFTEVGAYYCEAGAAYGEGPQIQQARFLVDELMPEFQPEHVFYYEMAWRYDEPPPCADGQADTALYAARGVDGPLLARSAAGVIFGSRPPTIASATATVASVAHLPAPPAPPSHLACEPGLGERWQHGECLYLDELFEA
jgi:hypothetical protein